MVFSHIGQVPFHVEITLGQCLGGGGGGGCKGVDHSWILASTQVVLQSECHLMTLTLRLSHFTPGEVRKDVAPMSSPIICIIKYLPVRKSFPNHTVLIYQITVTFCKNIINLIFKCKLTCRNNVSLNRKLCIDV